MIVWGGPCPNSSREPALFLENLNSGQAPAANKSQWWNLHGTGQPCKGTKQRQEALQPSSW